MLGQSIRQASDSDNPVRHMSLPERSYLICANQRSGSTLLCRALSDTGLAGHPREYFLADRPEAVAGGYWEDGPLAREHGGVRNRGEYLDLVYRLGTSSNGVFGAKLMWNNVVWAVKRFREMDEFAALSKRADVFYAVFPSLSVVHLVRSDVVRQAVSWARAAQDGVWFVSERRPPSPTGEPEYCYEFISNLVGLLLKGERGWSRLFSELGLTPYHVLYEDLLSDDGYRASVAAILSHLGLESDIEIPAPRTLRQADRINEAWTQRFLAEASGRDHPMLNVMMRRHIGPG
jgi:LPS sulfotransferase NodH